MNPPIMRFVAIAGLLLVGLAASPVLAQTPASPPAGEPETRAELLRRAREQKQTEVEPYEQNPVERGMILAERRIIPLLNRDGVYARMGSLSTGSGFAYGGGYRDRSLVRGRGKLDLWAAASLKRYWALEARGGYPLSSDERVTVEGHVRRFSSPHEEFFGIGPESRRADQAAYDLSGTETGADLNVALERRASFGGGIRDLRYTADSADSESLRSVEQVFGLVDAPGLQIPQRFTVGAAHFTYDYRQPLNARKGGYYRLDVRRYHDRARGNADFTRLDVDLRQYVSILSERRVFVGRAVISTTEAGEGDAIPYFLLPALGGNDTLRGFRAYRFRGPHSLLLQGEYRFEVWSGFDAALFVDAGKVALLREDLNFRGLERDFGIGFRFNTDQGVIARVDAAFGSRDGKHLHVVFGGLF
jgi:outer membrane protein assembly factor BamA